MFAAGASVRETRCRSRRRPGARQRLGDRVERGKRLRLVQRRELGQLAQLRLDRASIRTASRKRSPPCTIRWPTTSASPSPIASALRSSPASTCARGAGSSCAASSRSSASSSVSFRLLEPALTTRTRSEPAMSVRLAARARAPGQFQSRDVRRVLAVLAGVGAVAQPLVGHLLAQVRGALAEAGHAVDHVHHQVEAVEVVEHRPCRTASSSCPPPCSRARGCWRGWPAVGQAVDQPRVAVVGEDHRPVGGEQRVELAVGQPVRVLGVGLQPHQVDDVDDADLQLGQIARAAVRPRRASRASARRRRRPARRRARRSSSLRPSQMPIPRVQWATASLDVR